MKPIECRFCGKRPHEVTRLVSDDSRGVAICLDCVMRCVEVFVTGVDEADEPSFTLTPEGQALAARLAGTIDH